jgi:light-regulated signal transduction histidine kinase (bacteriophytochrome)
LRKLDKSRFDIVVLDNIFATQRRERTGLGLSISPTLIKRQRGQIMVESEIGRGSTFRVWLPEAGAGRHANRAAVA